VTVQTATAIAVSSRLVNPGTSAGGRPDGTLIVWRARIARHGLARRVELAGGMTLKREGAAHA
jgi:hypothetical protein